MEYKQAPPNAVQVEPTEGLYEVVGPHGGTRLKASYLLLPAVRASWEPRFWKYVRKGPKCWVWTGGSHRDRYGALRIEGKTYGAPALAFLLKHGRWAVGETRHKCDNRPCVRPSHLLEGSTKDNVQDAIRRGRFRGLDNLALGRGLPSWRRKLSNSEVRFIRAQYQPYSREFGSSALSQRFGVPHTTIQRVARGLTYKEVI